MLDLPTQGWSDDGKASAINSLCVLNARLGRQTRQREGGDSLEWGYNNRRALLLREQWRCCDYSRSAGRSHGMIAFAGLREILTED